MIEIVEIVSFSMKIFLKNSCCGNNHDCFGGRWVNGVGNQLCWIVLWCIKFLSLSCDSFSSLPRLTQLPQLFIFTAYNCRVIPPGLHVLSNWRPKMECDPTYWNFLLFSLRFLWFLKPILVMEKSWEKRLRCIFISGWMFWPMVLGKAVTTS